MLRQALGISWRSLAKSTPSNTAAALLRPRIQAIQAPQPHYYSFLRPASAMSRRLYSTAEEQKPKGQDGEVDSPAQETQEAQGSEQPQQPGESSPAGSDAATVVESTPESALQKALDAKDGEMRAWKDKCLRQMAEYQNLQDRTARAQKQARDFAIQAFAKDLLENIDNLDRALGMVAELKKEAPEDKQDQEGGFANLHEGLRLTESGLMKTLERHGLIRFDPMGEPFNPNEHEATFMTPQPDKENNHVFHVQQKGFKLNGRVLRAAKVGVVKNA